MWPSAVSSAPWLPVSSGVADGGGHAGDVRFVQPGDALHVDRDAVAEAGGEPEQAAFGSFSELRTIINIRSRLFPGCVLAG